MGNQSNIRSLEPANSPNKDGAIDAQLVWNTWRRILSDDGLVGHVTQAGQVDDAVLASLSSAERAVVAEYARTPQATQTNIGMYRRSLVRIVRVALGRVPLSQHLLFMSGLDVDDVAEEFARVNGYADDGPNFWRLAGTFIAYLATRPEFTAPAHQDVLALDQALAELARRLSQDAANSRPNGAATGFSDPGRSVARFVASRAAVVAKSRHDLTQWIENPYGYDPTEAQPDSPRYWMIYFPDADSEPAYAELTERSAHIFELLETPHTAAEVARALGTLSEAEALKVIGRLAELGVVADDEAWQCPESNPSPVLSGDSFVMLDPAVEVLDVEIAEYGFLCHCHFEVGMTMPPGEGLLDFVADLADKPVRVGALRKSYDDQRLVEEMLTALRQHGFLHVTSQETPPAGELARLRRLAAERRQASLRNTVVQDLMVASAEAIRAGIEGQPIAPLLQLRCTRLGDHAATLAGLAGLRKAGQLRLHHTVVQVSDAACDAGVARSLRRLGAEVIVEGVPWPAPGLSVAGLEGLTQAGVPVYAQMTPDRSFLDPAARARARAWAESVFLCGLCLELDAEVLWPDAEANETDFTGVFEAVQALSDTLGDVCIANLPDDEVLLGNAWAPGPEVLSGIARRFRLAYLRWRLPLLKSFEGDNTFSQTPEAEEKLVRLREDLLPNHPALLDLVPGSIVVDVCGGNGRVARRLSPHVGSDGLVISVEMLRCVTDRARRFVCEGGFTNVQFRTGVAQRIPLPDAVADAAVNEWTGAIWQLGLGPAMLAEMARVVRPGGRVAVTHRLVRLPLTRLGEPWVQFDDIYTLMHAAFNRPELSVVTERVWGQTTSTLVGERATSWRKHYVPRIVNPFDVTYTEDSDPGPHADVILTIIAERIG
jgi:ubiquinone/menaquinone biosynthesis C-methylase UbiE